MNTTFTFTTEDKKQEIFVYKWLPDSKPKAILQISHGMAEHAERYANFAKELNDAGYGVYANDHRGHGQTAGTLDKVGFFDEKDGWFKVLADMKQLTTIIKKENPETPVFILGHSMGSLLLRTYVMKYSEKLNGILFSGTSGETGIIVKLGKVLANVIGIFKPKQAPSKLLMKMSFGEFNKPFAPNKTAYDWLSSDEKQVKKYVKDKFCGTYFSNRFFYDLLTGVNFINNKNNIAKTPKDLPIYMFSGDMDPVGDFTKGVKKVYNIYKEIGVKDVEMKFYKDGRHESINEVFNKDVYKDIINWLDKKC